MARERIRLLFNPYPQLFYRALFAALVGHALVLAAMGLYASGPSLLQSDPPVVVTSVSLVLAIPPNRVVLGRASAPPRPAPKALAEPPPKLSPTQTSKVMPKTEEPSLSAISSSTTPVPTGEIVGDRPSGTKESDRGLSKESDGSSGSSANEAMPLKGKTAVSRSPPTNYCPVSDSDYPKRSLANGESGVTVVEVLIDKNGAIKDSKVNKSSGFFRLDQAALRVVLPRCKFTPGLEDGIPVESRAVFGITWKPAD